jgi:methionyl aminopeptidase
MDRVIQPGDLVSVDIGVRLAGGIGDTAFTVSVGPPRWRQALDLLRAAEESLTAGIAAAGAGHFVNDIGTAVERVVRRAGFSVVRDFVGHGCGTELHEPPEVPNFSQSSRGERLRPGMVLAIEPMVNTGASEVTVDSDGWTVRTADGGLSAHVEHMVLVTTGEPEVLTWPRTA